MTGGTCTLLWPARRTSGWARHAKTQPHANFSRTQKASQCLSRSWPTAQAVPCGRKLDQHCAQLPAEPAHHVEKREKLFLSVNTINTHRNNLMQKLDIHDTAGLVRYAFESGLTELKV